MEQFMEQALSRCGRESIECVTGSIGKGAAKSQYLLELYGGVQLQVIRCGCRDRRAPCGLRRGGKAFVARCYPNGNLGAAIRHLVPGCELCGCGSGWPDDLRNNRR